MDGVGGGGGFRPLSGAGGGFGANNHQAPLLSGQKRGFPFSDRGGSSPEHFDGGSFAKLFVGSVPRTATEEDIRPLFEVHGNVVEVALIKDKRTGLQQGCCFIKYATSEEADRAIRALHNQHTLPGGVGPIQVRYADGERERLGAVEYKLFVGSLNKHATEKEVEEIFSKYGRVEDVYLMRDNMKQSRGCGFVKYSHRDMAVAAINALNGIYTMRGCDQPLTVRFADPKRPRPGDSRGGPAFGGPGVGPRFQPPGARAGKNFGDPMGDRIPPNAWHPISPPNLRPPSNADIRGFGGQLFPRSSDMAVPLNPAGPLSGIDGVADSSHLRQAVTSQQSFNQSTPQLQPISQQISPFQKPVQSPQHLPPSIQSHPQTSASYAQMQMPRAPLQQLGHPQLPHSAGQTPFSQALPSQQLLGLGGQLSVSQPQVHQTASSAAVLPTPLDINLKPHSVSIVPNLLRPPASVSQQPPLQQPPSQLAQMLSQQTQSLQASFQSSQQAFSQLQQQLQLMQPSNQGLTSLQSSQAIKQQTQWAGIVPQIVASTLATTAPATDVPSSKSAAPAVPLLTQAVAPVKSNWTEHTSPDGYKYYHNGVTGESRWEKPEELALLEQKHHQKPQVQQPQAQSIPHVPSAQQVRQTQQLQMQAQLQTQLHQQQQQQQLQQPTLSSLYQASGVTGHQNIQDPGYTQLQVVAGSVSDPTRFQQGLQASQEWMWKNKPAGT
ncbi:hypothetical protein F2P56_027258 [Juglans regia]|uniref:Flowering time control protein FCA n=2 Tax=Juglans regia TaxID=51240 RepID=A0A833UAI2_JUGRE|nr:flowering time control protein FCA-like isoform X2 [Juglans regia]KAF5452233.1 hypothetical protein F2P56_027258 [Juglans regia]